MTLLVDLQAATEAQEKEFSKCSKHDDATASTASMSSFSSCASSFYDDDVTGMAFIEEFATACGMPTNESSDASNDCSRFSEEQKHSYETLRRKLNKVSKRLEECRSSRKKYHRLLDKQARYIAALVGELVADRRLAW